MGSRSFTSTKNGEQEGRLSRASLFGCYKIGCDNSGSVDSLAFNNRRVSSERLVVHMNFRMTGFFEIVDVELV